MKRSASHAGSWYSSDTQQLTSQLSNWLNSAEPAIDRQPRAIIAPHAGYAYSGQTAAYSYTLLQNGNYERVYLLGPSHHFYLEGCALSKCSIYETPIGNLAIDTAENSRLFSTGLFTQISKGEDEDEHSIEMHLPYLRFVAKRDNIKIVPVLVGALDETSADTYGSLFAELLLDERNLFIISSDFCHWGPRFRYSYLPPNLSSDKAIHEKIEALDKEGMSVIQTCSASDFSKYLERTQNTICGRNPIMLLLHCIERLVKDGKVHSPEFKFTHYAQSNPAKSSKDNSVSYASGYLLF